MPSALTNGRTGGVASPSATQQLVYSSVTGSRPYPYEPHPRPYPDTSRIVGPPGSPTYQVTAADTALNMGADTVTAATARTGTADTALTVTATVVAAVARTVGADTALTMSDTPAVTFKAARTASEVALNVAATLAATIGRPGLADTALAVTVTVTMRVATLAATVALTVDDVTSVTFKAARIAADTALAVTETLVRGTARNLADTALVTVTGTVTATPGRPLTDTALTLVVTNPAARATLPLSDSALAVTAQLAVRGPTRPLTDTALTVGDTVAVLSHHPPSDYTALQLTDTTLVTATRVTADTALTVGDTVTRSVTHPPTLVTAADTALNVTDTIRVTVPRTVGGLGPSDTLAPGDTLAAGVNVALSLADAVTVYPTRGRSVGDTALNLTATLSTRAARVVSSVALQISDAVIRLNQWSLADTAIAGRTAVIPAAALAPGDTLAPDTYNGIAETLTAGRGRLAAITEAALSFSDSTTITAIRALATLALQISDQVLHLGRQTLADNALAGRPTLTLSSSLAPGAAVAPDGGNGITETLTAGLVRSAAIPATALTIIDTLNATATRAFPTVALQISDQVAVDVVYVTNVRGHLTTRDGPTVTVTLAGRAAATVYVADSTGRPPFAPSNTLRPSGTLSPEGTNSDHHLTVSAASTSTVTLDVSESDSLVLAEVL